MKPLTTAQLNSMIAAGKRKTQNVRETEAPTVRSTTNLTNAIKLQEVMRAAAQAAKKSVYEAAGLKFPQDNNSNPQVELLAREAAQSARKKVQSEFNIKQ